MSELLTSRESLLLPERGALDPEACGLLFDLFSTESNRRALVANLNIIFLRCPLFPERAANTAEA